MGGNALSVPSVRLTRKNFERLNADLHRKLIAAYPQLKFATVESYRAKADFGDLDMLIGDSGFNAREAALALGAVEVVTNGPVTSCGLLVDPTKDERDGNMFQVDFIKVAAAEYEYAKSYFAWNDLGNLVGRIAHKMGLAHKHDGLYFFVREGDYLFREILLTRDYDQALTAMGYCPERFARGFDTPLELFEYTASTRHFNVEIFLLDNRNAKSRVRDSKRKTYMDFLDWCEQAQWLPAYGFPNDKAEWLPHLFTHFPAFRGEYEKALHDLERSREVKAKFNGELVGSWTGLTGKELGMVMKRFREGFASQEALHHHVLQHSQEELKAQVLALSTVN